MKLDPGATVAVVGASARAAAFSLLRAGYRVVTADLFADADLQRQCEATRIAPYPDGFVDWLPTAPCDAWLYTGALENHPTLVDRLSSSRRLLGHPGDTLRNVRDPLQLQTTLTQVGLHFPETRPATEPPTNANDWLGKTYRGSCGSGVSITTVDGYLQRRVEGVALSAVYAGNQLIGVTRQLVGESWAGAGQFQYCGTITPWPLSPDVESQLIKLGEVLSSEFALTELYGVDLVFDGDKSWVIEVNPRYTAAVEVVERAAGISVFNADIAFDPCACVGKVILYAKAPLVVSPHASDALLAEAGDLPWPQIADIPTANTEVAIGQPILTLFATGNSCDEVERRLRERAIEIEQQLYGKAFPCV